MINYNKYLERLKSKGNNIENYYYKELKGQTDGTILNHLISISKLFETEKQRNESWRSKTKDFNLKNNNINLLTEQNIKDFLDSDWWNNLSSGTQKMHVNRIKKYIKYSERKDLLNLLPTKINRKTKKLSKIDLITKKDLKQILKYSNLQYKTLFIILYEGALRINEVLNIRKKDIKFNSGYIILKITESKTYGRDVAVMDDANLYIKEYLGVNDFEPNDKLFNFKNNTTVNNYLNFILKKLIKKYPKQWKGRKLYPHLFRHSKLTELAAGKLNEAQIRKFAGWSADSTMAKIYFHLDDKDVINILTNNVVEAPKPEPNKPKICKICNTENPQEYLFCYKCKNVFNEEGKEQMGVEIIIQPHQIRELRQENKNLKDELVAMKDVYKTEMDNLREEMKGMFDELYYRQDTEARVKKGETTFAEAQLESEGYTKEDIEELKSQISKPKKSK